MQTYTHAQTSSDSPNPPDLADMLDHLFEVIQQRERLLTAFSGGVDSTLVAAASRQVLGKSNAPVVIGDSPSLPRRALRDAMQLAEQLDLELHIVQPNEITDPTYQRNDGQRCFSCKTHLYSEMLQLADELGIDHLANGTNLDDQGDHRPGLVAAAKAKVVSPLVEARLGKIQVRGIAMAMGLSNWDKPAAACLSSRVQYGMKVTPQVLAQIEQAEASLADLGFSGFRVRHHDKVARLELPWSQVDRLMTDDMRQRVIQAVQAAGYAYVTLDLEGFRSGSGNVLLRVEGEG